MIGIGESLAGKRERNEDSFVVDPSVGLFAVADGVGGHAGGGLASRLVVSVLREEVGSTPPGRDVPKNEAWDEGERLTRAFLKSREELCRHARGPLVNMASTLSAVRLFGEFAIIAHVGDSRVYRLRDGGIEQLTRDHSVRAELEALGGPALLRRVNGFMNHALTRCVSPHLDAEPDLRVERVKPGDRFLICSDGVTDVLDDSKLASLLGDIDAAQAAHSVVSSALAAGSTDNVTAVVVDLAA